MHCRLCENRLPLDNYAVVDGMHFCLRCFVGQYTSFATANSIEHDRWSPPTYQPVSHSSWINTLDSTTLWSNISANTRSNAGKFHCLEELLNFSFGIGEYDSPTVTGTFQQQYSYFKDSSLYTDNPKLHCPSVNPRRACQVCLDDKHANHFRPISHHLCLQTERTICDECIYHHIQVSFQEMCNDDVRCPELQCNLEFDYHTIVAILTSNNDKQLLERYDRFQMQSLLEQMDEFIWCSNPKCQMGQLNAGGDTTNIVTCIYCGEKTCFTHKTAWHQGLTCEQYDTSINEDLRASLRWINQNTKTCPNCRYDIEKNNGCDHMTCAKCKHEFCWCCLASYEPIRRMGNHQHHQGCKHYS